MGESVLFEKRCSDIAGTTKCEELRSEWRCKNGQFMQENCRASCGLCEGNDEKQEESVEVCEDVLSRCLEWKEDNKCIAWSNFMKKNCAETCDFCSDEIDDNNE